MSILTASPSPNNPPLCPACGVETPLAPTDIAGVVHCPRCWRTFLDGNLDGVFVGRAPDSEREPDDDAPDLELSLEDIDWNNQVLVGRGPVRQYGLQAAIAVATELFFRGRWNGRGRIVVHEPYAAHAKACRRPGALAAGVDFEIRVAGVGR